MKMSFTDNFSLHWYLTKLYPRSPDHPADAHLQLQQSQQFPPGQLSHTNQPSLSLLNLSQLFCLCRPFLQAKLPLINRSSLYLQQTKQLFWLCRPFPSVQLLHRSYQLLMPCPRIYVQHKTATTESCLEDWV